MRQAPSRAVQLIAPVGGWDTREAIADMPPSHAVVMDNWFPGADKVTVRPGYAAWATGLGAPVESLMPYAGLSGAGRLFAAAGSSVWDVTASGTVGAAAVTGLSNARWQSVQIGTAGGQFLFMVNGADAPRLFDGASWTNAAVTGPVAANLAWCNLHQRRLWFGERNSLTAWYLPVNSIGGTAAPFSLAAVARLGGYIVGMGTWSRDDPGGGLADMAVFLTSEGEAVIYRGTNPDDAAAWGLAGVFRLGKPIGARPMLKTLSDLIIITQTGFVAASTVLPTEAAQTDGVALSKQINRAVNSAVAGAGGLFGWEPFVYPRGQMLLFNVPQPSTAAHQYVFNTLTSAPARFTGIPALTWGLSGGDPFFGTPDGRVCRFDGVWSDAGAPIQADALQAFSYFGSPGMKKAFKLVQPIFEANADPRAAVGLALDFDTSFASAGSQPSTISAVPSLWGAAAWGSAKWGSGARIWQGWRGVRGMARAAAPRVRVSTAGAQVSWVATGLTFVPGGQL